MKFIDITPRKRTKITLKKPDTYVLFFYNFSGKLTIEIMHKNINVHILGLYFGHNTDHFSLKTIQRHISPNSKSNLLIRGIFFDRARFEYEGLIKIEKQAQKSRAYQKVQGLIFSPQCTIETKPYLEILANDVFCTHGATTGQLPDDQIHYLKTRGIKTSRAKKLLTQGFINDIFNKIEEFGLINRIDKYQSLILNNLKNVTY
ncbi:SufD family Fe-S cluster assembly protein [Patescibacteria group bacterium AH-259-L07]|nr:SufD family Fe-S cluster assembly protein [Patescibacteria group bacterium AH-259-L07]